MKYIVFWNYSKNVERGAREIEIFLDRRIIYKVSKEFNLKGVLPRYSPENKKSVIKLKRVNTVEVIFNFI